MQAVKFEFDAIGTRWIIDFDPSNSSSEKLLAKIKSRIDKFDISYSRFKDNSFVTKISKSKGKYTLPDDAKPMFDLYRDLYRLTDGYFSPFLGNLLSDLGYDKDYSLKTSKKVNNPFTWNEAIESYNFPYLILKQPVLLDVGACGKGYLIDIIANLLLEENISSFCIEAGGDILYKNSQGHPLRVGLENPKDLKQVIGVKEILNESICGSAGNRRKWGKYHHIINTKTLTSPEDIVATWVIAKETILSDALSTCLFFTPASKLSKYYNFEYFLLKKDFTFEKSNGFNAELF